MRIIGQGLYMHETGVQEEEESHNEYNNRLMQYDHASVHA